MNYKHDFLYDILHNQCKTGDIKAQDKLAQRAIGFLQDHGKNPIVENGMYGWKITVGEAELYPCLVAHLDQVHEPKNMGVYDCDGVLIAVSDGKQVGIGGDDKCGVYASAIIALDKPVKICFFYDEEGFGRGGSHLITGTDSFFNDVSFLIGLDRKGNSDLITNTNGFDIASDDMISEVKHIMIEHGYSEGIGTFTDVGEIVDTTDIGGFNVSVGYYNEHTSYEHIELSDLEGAIDFVGDLIDALGHKQWTKPPYKYHARYSGAYAGSGWDMSRNMNQQYIDANICPRCYNDTDGGECEFCGYGKAMNLPMAM